MSGKAISAFDGASTWLNSEPLTAASLHGRAVLVDFWTYSCINWLRTLPYLRAWTVSLWMAGRGEPSAQPSPAGVRADRNPRLRRSPLFRRVRRVCQRDRDDALIRITVANRGDAAAPIHVLHDLVSQRRSWIPGAPRPNLHALIAPVCRRRSGSKKRSMASGGCTAAATRRGCSRTTSRTRGACSAWTATGTSRTGLASSSSTAVSTRSIPCSAAPRRPRITGTASRRAASRRSSCGSPGARPTSGRSRRSAPSSTTSSPAGKTKPTPSTRP